MSRPISGWLRFRRLRRLALVGVAEWPARRSLAGERHRRAMAFELQQEKNIREIARLRALRELEDRYIEEMGLRR